MSFIAALLVYTANFEIIFPAPFPGRKERVIQVSEAM